MLPKFFKSKNSLTRTTIIKMGIRIAIIIIAVTLVSYWHIMSNLELQVIEQLDKYITERGHRDSNLLELAEANHISFKDEFLRRYQAILNEDVSASFDQVFELNDDGIIRMRTKYFHGVPLGEGAKMTGMSGFIQENVTVTDDLRRRLIIGHNMVSAYGPVWENRFPDLYLSVPEKAVVVYWPKVIWVPEKDSKVDYFVTDEPFYIGNPEYNSQRDIVWSGIYYEEIGKEWLVSCVTPVDFNGKHIATVGSDILLSDLFERTINDHLEGAYNIIFQPDGRLIAHPNQMDAIQAGGGNLYIQKSQDQNLNNIFERVTNRQPGQTVIENHKDDELLAITKIEGPNWYLVTVYPKSLMANLAFNTASFILFLGLLSLLIEITVLFFVLRRQIAQPLQEFIDATKKIASRNFSVKATQHLPLSRQDEIGELAHSFNGMAEQLKTSFDTLDAKVIERTAQLNDKIEELTKTRQELVQSEKMAALGQLVAGIAHEVNTPLGAIRSSAETLTSGLKQTLAQFPKLFKVLTPIQQDTFFTLLEHSLQNSIILTIKEKRAAKKTLTTELKQCGIANPRIFTETFISLGIYAQVDQYLLLLQNANSDFVFEIAYKLSTLTRSTANITTAVERASKVIFALKTFARHDQSGEKATAHLQEGLETVLTLYHSQIKQGIELIKEYEDLLPILCYPDELNQVWTNILHNALQAMNYKGSLKVTISQQDNYAVVAITDSGQGIPSEIKDQIFTPFFTTKAAGEGSGLGLDIVQKIVDKHNGKIEVDSEVGKGTTFSVWLPKE
ncbi:ATP-binding protein [Candidatus Parabeggiatoa sp. HSG14]|uniref:sensor histidine kinase n=1 Tax=Candidatus Parabeggiatoa sp. HSG14 TaxID=3055593 RepID=UPI0025A71637|nr:ATP-binding protein [Thiotrichales bacterium HSG14]